MARWTKLCISSLLVLPICATHLETPDYKVNCDEFEVSAQLSKQGQASRTCSETLRWACSAYKGAKSGLGRQQKNTDSSAGIQQLTM